MPPPKSSTQELKSGGAPGSCSRCCCSPRRCRTCHERWRRRSQTSPGVRHPQCPVAPCPKDTEDISAWTPAQTNETKEEENYTSGDGNDMSGQDKRSILPRPAVQIAQPYLVARQHDVISFCHLSGETEDAEVCVDPETPLPDGHVGFYSLGSTPSRSALP